MTDKASLSQDQRQYFDAAKSLLDKDKLKSLLFRLTDIHSPTGSTQAACSMLVEHIRDTLCVDAKVMSMAGESAAGYARLKGEGGGANLLLYAPIDTHLEGDESDTPWVGPKVTADLLPEAKMVDDWVFGLGSSNPKAMVATLAEVFRCVREANVPLLGDLSLGFEIGRASCRERV